MTIDDALFRVRERIRTAAAKSDRNPDDVKLIAVSKTVTSSRVAEAIQAGITLLGENRVQEAQNKIDALRAISDSHGARWHLIGHLQKNKAKSAVTLFSLIHTVDSVSLARELDRRAKALSQVQDILIQVKLADEDTKQGMSEDALPELLNELTALNNLRLQGLMTIPPYCTDPEDARPYFRHLRHLAEKTRQSGYTAHELSMGMSHDLEVAVEEGATYVRVGTALFGERHYA